MSAALGWLLAGSALLLTPGRSTASGAGRGGAERGGVGRAEAGRGGAGRGGAGRGLVVGSGAGGGGPQAGRAAVAIAVASAAAGCLAAFGLHTGLPLAAVVGPATGAAVRWLQRRPARVEPDRSLALVLDLAAAALRSGRPLADALALAAPAGRPETAGSLLRVAGLSRLGADAVQAWSAVPRDGPLGEVAAAAVRSAASGLKLAAAFERLAAQIRTERSAAAAVRAHRAGVAAMAPLAACFLPSFVCLGVVPVVVGMAQSALGVLP